MLKINSIIKDACGNYARIIGWSENEVYYYADYSEFQDDWDSDSIVTDSEIVEICNYIDSPLWRALNE